MQQPTGDARRTSLANERTQLAWWRTGLTALAVGLAVGRVVPNIGHGHTQWPYTTVGALFAIYGIALIGFGMARGKAVEEASARGEFAETPHHALATLGFSGMTLGLLVVLLVLFD
jgi:putative membrane protein